MSRENHHEAQPLVSVVIVNWNRCDDVVETLTDLQSQTYQNIETIVVDNGSVDDSIITLEEKFPEVKCPKSDSFDPRLKGSYGADLNKKSPIESRDDVIHGKPPVDYPDTNKGSGAGKSK